MIRAYSHLSTNLKYPSDVKGWCIENHATFADAYFTYASQLFYYAHKNISSREDCEEIIQDVFVSLWERRDELEIQSLRHYLFNAVRYKIIRYFQHDKVKKRYAEHLRFFESVYDDLAEHEAPDIEHIQQAIDQCVEELPDRCKTAFRLRLHENLSNGEIAQRMNISKKTVEIYIFKTFTHLRQSYSRIFSEAQVEKL